MDEPNKFYEFIKRRQYTTIILWIFIIFMTVFKLDILKSTERQILLIIIILWHIEWIIRRIIEIKKVGSIGLWFDNTKLSLKVSLIVLLVLVALLLLTLALNSIILSNSTPIFITIMKYTGTLFVPAWTLMIGCLDDTQCQKIMFPIAIIINIYLYIWISNAIVSIIEKFKNNKKNKKF